MAKVNTRLARKRRHIRVRRRVSGTCERPRLCVFRSTNHIYAQIIDDINGHTLVAASTVEPVFKGELSGKNKTATSEVIGTAIAERALGKGISSVAFDRGGFRYHGRVKALAEAARQGGLKF